MGAGRRYTGILPVRADVVCSGVAAFAVKVAAVCDAGDEKGRYIGAGRFVGCPDASGFAA